MLSIQWIENPEYYLDQSNADYYFAGGEPPGRWSGGASRLGLTGVITREALRAIFKGMTEDGRPLVQLQANRNHQAAWDLTFSAPKAFSVLWSAAKSELREKLDRLHDAAVQAGIECLNKHAAYTRRGKGGQRLENVELVFALFRHSTSRELDPQVHTHALLINVCTRADGTTGTIVSNTVYDHKMLAGQVYRNALARGLMELGFGVTANKDGFDIKGIPDELCQEQSKRRKAIEQLLGSKNLSSAKASQVATLATRKAKQIPPRSELFAAWQKTNEQYGLTPESIDKLIERPQRRRPIGIDDKVAASVAQSALQAVIAKAVKSLSDQHSHFSARDVYREALRESLELGFDVEAVRAAVQMELETKLINVGRRDGYIRYSTAENIALEQKLLANIEQLAKDHRHRIDPEIVARHLDHRLPLGPELEGIELARNREQRNAVEHLTVRSGATSVLVGMAGTGKTFTLGVCNEIWRDRFQVRGLTLAGAAARRLEEGSGIKSDTLAMFLTKLEHATEVLDLFRGTTSYLLPPTRKNPDGETLLDRSHVIVVDEAAMCGTKQLEKLVAAVTVAGAKLILVGDRKQLQPIEAGGPMRAIEERAGKADLTVITRQREQGLDPQPQWQREAVQHFARGEAADGLLLLAERGKVSVLEDREAAKIALVRDWTAQSVDRPRDHLVLAPTNADVADLNDLCQLARKQKNLIGDQHINVGQEPIHIGDRVLCTRRSRALKVENGDFGSVIRINARKKLVTVELDRGAKVDVPVKEFPHLQRGYACTVHKSQGASIERTSVLVGGSMENLHQSYVEASRHKQECRLYASRWEAGQLLQDLAIQMARSNEKDLALDVMRENETVPEPQSRDYYRLPERASAQPRLALQKLERLRGLLVPPGPQTKPPTKSKEEVEELLEKLRADVIRKRAQDSDLATTIPPPLVHRQTQPEIQPEPKTKEEIDSLLERLHRDVLRQRGQESDLDHSKSTPELQPQSSPGIDQEPKTVQEIEALISKLRNAAVRQVSQGSNIDAEQRLKSKEEIAALIQKLRDDLHRLQAPEIKSPEPTTEIRHEIRHRRGPHL